MGLIKMHSLFPFKNKKYDKLELPCLVEEWHDKDFTLYTATKIQKLDHGSKSMKHISEQTSVHNQEYIYIYTYNESNDSSNHNKCTFADLYLYIFQMIFDSIKRMRLP